MIITALYQHLKHYMPNTIVHVGPIYRNNIGNESVDVTIGSTKFMVDWNQETKVVSVMVIRASAPDLATLPMGREELGTLATLDDVALYIAGVVAKTPTKLGWSVRLWLAVRPYVIWMIPKVLRGVKHGPSTKS